MKILIIQLRRIGDVLLTTPALRYLKENIPGVEIDMLVEKNCAPALKLNPDLNDVLIYDKSQALKEIRRVRARHYDAVLDFMNNPRTAYLTFLSGARWRVGWRHGVRRVFYNIAVPIPLEPEYVPKRKIRLVKYWMTKAGIVPKSDVSFRPSLFLSSDEKMFSEHWMNAENVNPKGYVVLAPAHRHPIRAWRKEGFRAVALRLREEWGKPVYLAWGPGEEEWMKEVQGEFSSEIKLLPLTSLREMAAIFQNAALVITNDSGAMHTTVGVGTPTVTIYGPTRPIDWNPSLSGEECMDKALTAPNVPCLGCHLDQCPVGHICMTRMDEKIVYEAAREILKESEHVKR